jgi:L-threonylcarbamoyladenylate synthase
MGAPIGIDLDLAADLLRSGKLVAIPTETVYGLAAHGLNPEAVAGIFAAKNRPTFDPLILHAANKSAAQSLCSVWPQAAETLANAFWPGPLTLVLPKAEIVPNLVTADHPTVAVRIPNNAMTLALLNAIDFPLAAPSANPFGYVSPTTAQHVADQLGDRIDYILDGGSCAVGIESTIVSVSEKNEVTVLRLGGLDLKMLEEVLGHPVLESLTMNSNPKAPGQLDQHYSPGARMTAWDPEDASVRDLFPNQQSQMLANQEGLATEKIGVLWFSETQFRQWLNDERAMLDCNHYFLSKSGDDKEAAMQLFAVLRRFDKDQCKKVYFQWAPEIGLGRAINDRLKRASAKL